MDFWFTKKLCVSEIRTSCFEIPIEVEVKIGGRGGISAT